MLKNSFRIPSYDAGKKFGEHERSVSVTLFVMLYKVVQTLDRWSPRSMKSLSVTIQMKATEQYFPVVLFIMLYKMVIRFESVDEILKCISSFINVILYKIVLNFELVEEKSPIK